MATLSDLTTRVQRALIDTPSSVQTEVPFLIREAVSDMQGRHNFEVMHTAVTFTTVSANPQLSAGLTRFKAWAEAPLLVTTDGATTPMVYGLGAKDQLFADNGRTGRPKAVYLGEPNDLNVRSVLVAPTPDALGDGPSGSYTIRAWYWRYLAPLTNSTDQNWFTNDDVAVQYIINQAVFRGFDLIEDEQRAQKWEQKAIAALAQVILNDKKNQLAAAQSLPSFYPANVPQTQR